MTPAAQFALTQLRGAKCVYDPAPACLQERADTPAVWCSICLGHALLVEYDRLTRDVVDCLRGLGYSENLQVAGRIEVEYGEGHTQT